MIGYNGCSKLSVLQGPTMYEEACNLNRVRALMHYKVLEMLFVNLPRKVFLTVGQFTLGELHSPHPTIVGKCSLPPASPILGMRMRWDAEAPFEVVLGGSGSPP